MGLQSPLASMMTQRIGVFESIFIVHLGGAMLSVLPLVLIGGGRLSQWRSVPWYALCAGFFGLVVIAAISYTIPLGVAASIITVVAGQLVVATIRINTVCSAPVFVPWAPMWALGLAVVMLGVWLTVK